MHKKVRSGSPANEIIKAAEQLDAGLVVVASGGRGISDTVLVGSTAQRVQHYAPCPVLVVRPAPRRKPQRAARKCRTHADQSAAAMETLRLVLLFLHMLGFAALLGGLIVQVRAPEKAVNAAMRDGAGTAFLAGLPSSACSRRVTATSTTPRSA